MIFNFAGMSPDQVEAHITSPYERVLTTTVEDIQHIESQSLYGIVVIKIFMQPTASLPKAVAQITAVSQTILRQLPTGTTPPLIISYTASNVPVILVGLGGSLSEQELNDLALNVVRIQLITIPGAAVPYPYGGKMKYVSVDLNYQALQAHGLVPSDVVNAISAQNVILPSGTVKIGLYEYQVGLNASPPELSQLNSLPIKTLPNGTTLYVRDVANVHSGNIPQTNIVRFNGARATMLVVQKTGTASTLDIVKAVKDRLPLLRQLLPDGAEISLLADQSVFVTGAISGVVREGVIAACLTAIMILLFLGDWKSTLIIAISIPLSILASLSLLSAIGQTINIMTLGGLALAVGILVDDATVTIENIDRHLAEGKSVIDGIRDGAAQIAIPAFVSTLCICIVFVPIFFLSGVAKYLFIPLAEAVIFAMIASYILSRTLVPTLAMYWIKGHSEEPKKAERRFFLLSWASAFQRGFENRFERFRESYRDLLSLCLNNGKKVILLVVGFVLASCLLFPFLGQDFFPSVDAGRFDMHVRMKSGTRIEETARIVDEIEQVIRKIIPADQLGEVIDNLGLPYSGINTSYNNTGTVSPADGDILVSLKEGHGPTNDFVRKIRLEMRKQFPDVTVWFPPADIVTQILNFGLSAPMDVQIVGSDRDEIFRFAGKLLGSLRKIPGLVDLRIQEPNDTPRLDITVDRTKASILGLTEQSVASSVLNALSGSQQLTLNFWVDPTSGVTYQLNAMVPQYDISSPDALMNLPVLGSTTGQNQILANVASISRSQTSPVMDSFNIRPAINIFAGVDGRDLGAVASDVQKAIDASRKDLPRGSVITLRGQVSTMQDSFFGLYVGLVFSLVLVYLLIVVNFQSWSEPFIIITALPVALVGIIWMLFITQTTLSVPALMGAIMCMGVATANSVLVITFANERFEEARDSYLAALEAGYTRIRPVLMTAGAMIIGMFPMALGLGEGGEQNAPLGRAVIGGLIFATGATLFFVPTVFRLLRRHKPSALRMPEAAKS